MQKRGEDWGRRPLGRWATLVVGLVVCFGPAWLFADPLDAYRLHSDDFAYLAASRTFGRACGNLLEPHNTHVVPSWRLVTWGVSAAAGSLANLPRVLPGTAYGILAATMILVGRLVARETGRTVVGLVAMAAVGTSALMESAATWYSAGQTLWAGFGVLATLCYLQEYRIAGGRWRLVLAASMCWVAGGFWTIGHAAGPVGFAYLWADGRPRCRRAVAVPLLATVVMLAVVLSIGARKMAGPMVSVHGRTVREAIDPVQGAFHTLQAIPENLVVGALAMTTATTQTQGVVLSGSLLVLWIWTLRRARRRPNGLELAGGVLVVSAYYVEWTIRGYLPFSSLRGPVVPWYDTIPFLGAVLFAAGWWAGSSAARPIRRPLPLTRRAALGVLAFQVALIALHQPRVEDQFENTLPGMSPTEQKMFPIPTLRRLRYVALGALHADWQRRHLARLDRAEAIARRRGIGLDGIARTFGRLDAPNLPKVYDAAALLDLPADGREDDPAVIRAALGPLVVKEPEPALPLAEIPRTGIPDSRIPDSRTGK